MFKKQCLIVALISINATMFAMEGETPRPIQQGTNISSGETNVHTPHVFMHSTGQNTYHTHQQPTFTAQTVSDNPVVNAAGILAKAAAEGAVQGVFHGALLGVVSVIEQKLKATLNEPTDERDARNLLSKNQQIENLSSLRDEVNNFDKETAGDEELEPLAHELRLGLGHALLAFIERQKKEEVCIVTPLLHKVQAEVNAFTTDTKETKDQEVESLRKKIQKNYGLLIYKQLQYEKESSKPAIVIMARP